MSQTPPMNELAQYLQQHETEILTDFQKFVDANKERFGSQAIHQIISDCGGLTRTDPMATFMWLVKHHPAWIKSVAEKIPEGDFPNQVVVMANIVRKVQF